MMSVSGPRLPQGIISVLQTPFDREREVDYESLRRLIEDAIGAGARGFLAPAVASEVDYLSAGERKRLVSETASMVKGRIPLIVGASSSRPHQCRQWARLAREVGAAAYLIAVPEPLYQRSAQDVLDFFQAAAGTSDLPLLIQDLEWSGPGLSLATIGKLKRRLPQLIGLKIETVPAGPKYTAVKHELGKDFFVCGGWAVLQMIEALDRGVDAMVPESSMVRVYDRIFRLHREGHRAQAVSLFRRLLPVLAFSNQEITTSIAFFKRLLVRRGIVSEPVMRRPGFEWDACNRRIADELIDDYLQLALSLES